MLVLIPVDRERRWSSHWTLTHLRATIPLDGLSVFEGRGEAQRTMVPDYYAMLGVDPGVDRSTLESALARCQPVWSSGTRNPKNKHTYQSYLDQIPALRQA